MGIPVVCPACRTSDMIADEQVGQEIHCRNCGALFRAVVSLPAAVRRPKRTGQGITTLGLFLVLGGVAASLLALVGCTIAAVYLFSRNAHLEDVEPVNAALQQPQATESDRGPAQEPARAKPSLGSPPAVPPLPRDPEFFAPPLRDADPADAQPLADGAQLSAETVQRVKQATVYLRVTLPDGRTTEGSGFFGGPPKVLLTNAHVVGMLHAGSLPPKSVEVVYNSGTKDEKKYPAQVVGVDHHADLAVLRVEASRTPSPLKIKSASSLHETQQVWVAGFPLGAGLGKEVTVSSSAVSSFRSEPNGMLSRIQVNGGMYPGNSGGPVVDASGAVVGVAVSIIRNTQINFAVPGDAVRLMLNGYVAGLKLGQPYRAEEGIRLPVTLTLVDPLDKVRQPAVEVWTGNPQPAMRPPTAAQPEAQSGDTPHRHCPLDRTGVVARAEILLPAPSTGKAIWFQPTWMGGNGTPQWATARVLDLPPPLERRPAKLAFKHQVGSRPLTLVSWLNLQTQDQEGREHAFTSNRETLFTETTEAIDSEDVATVQLQYRDYNHLLWLDRRSAPLQEHLQRVRQNLGNVRAQVRIDRHGNPSDTQFDLSHLSQALRTELSDVSDQVSLLLIAALPLPNRRVSPNESWKAERDFGLHIQPNWSEAGRLDLTCTYLGVRPHEGKEVAVVALAGPVRGKEKESKHITGQADGLALIDLAGGEVVRADLHCTLEILFRAGNPSRVSGTLDLRSLRPPAASAPRPSGSNAATS
jgi:S1-C subfamily serine protease